MNSKIPEPSESEQTRPWPMQEFKASVKITLGTCLQNRYRIQKKLGQGGMAIVYEALDQQTQSQVAIKQILSRFSLDDDPESKEAMERLKREYHLLHGLQHPNLVKVFNLFEEHEQFFLVMEIVSGISLQEFIQQHPAAMPLSQQLAVAYHIANAVSALNQAGIIHRDIKPANIMLIPHTNRLVLLDLGLAKSLRQKTYDITATGSIVGTAEYLSPEQVNSEISNKSDVFSLAITLYQFFTWQLHSPFKSKSPVMTMSNILTQNPPPLIHQIKRHLRDFERPIYRNLSTLLEKALEKDAAKRALTAALIRNDMERLYNQLPKRYANLHQEIWTEEVKTEDSAERTSKYGIYKEMAKIIRAKSAQIWKWIRAFSTRQEVRWYCASAAIALIAVFLIWLIQIIFT